MTKPYSFEEVRPNIFFLNYTNHYDMCMTFLRYQEYYESTSPKFRGKSFKILDFMKWYSNKYGNGAFTYPADWEGFNIPSSVVIEVNKLGIEDRNDYDSEMWNIYETCIRKTNENFYIIAAIGKNTAMKHEIAHGFFYLNPEYKREMLTLVNALDSEFKKKLYNQFKQFGYTTKVYKDECQAYLSTGIEDVIDFKLNGEDKPFIKLFERYYKE